jgi:hypothetical protein
MSNQELFLEVSCGGKKLYEFAPKKAALAVLYYVMGFPRSWMPLDSLRENFIGCLDLLTEYCQMFTNDIKLRKKFCVAKRTADSLTKKFFYTKKLVERFGDKLNYMILCRMYYNLVLSIEGLGTLRRFKMGNRWGDVLIGDPEKVSVRGGGKIF